MDSKQSDDLLGLDDADDDYCETYCEESGSPEEIAFDEAVGALEEILMMDDEFTDIQKQFFEEHCDKFKNDEENRVEYTAVFEDYTALMESTLERKLCERIASFDMHSFETQLISRKDEIGGDIFDLLLSFSDFTEFKSMILAHKADRDGTGVQLGDCIHVSNFNENAMSMSP